MANVQQKTVIGFTPYWTDEQIVCDMNDGSLETVTIKELKTAVTDVTGMVDVSIDTPNVSYISFQDYLDEEFLGEANNILTGIINSRADV